MEDLKDLSLKTVNSCSLVYLNEGLFDLYEEFGNWIDNLCSHQPFFHKIEKILRICYAYIYDEVTKEIYKKRECQKEHQHFLLKNFISFLEIFLNEFRKSLISTGDYDYSSEDRNQTVKLNSINFISIFN